MKIIFFISLLVVLITSCTKQVTVLNHDGTESIFQDLNLKIFYYDGFYKGYTSPGDLGKPQIGNEYFIMGKEFLPHTGTVRIEDNILVTDDNNTSYVNQNFDGNTVNYACGRVRWAASDKPYANDGVFIVLLSEYGGLNIATNCLHIRSTRYRITFDVFNKNWRQDGWAGPLKSINEVRFNDPLQIGRFYTFRFISIGNRIYYKVDGIMEDYVADDNYLNKIGSSVCFEAYYNPGNNNTVNAEFFTAGQTQ